MLHYLLITGTTSDIGALLPTLVSLQKNFSYCISNNTVTFCSNCKNGGYNKNKVDKGLPLNTSATMSSCANETTSLSYSPIRSISTIIPKRNNNKDESHVLSMANRKKSTGLTYSSTKSVTNSPEEDNRMDESPEPTNPTTNLSVSSISSVSKPIQDKQTNESPSRSVSSDECMEQTTISFGSSKMSSPKVIPSQNEYTDEKLKTIASPIRILAERASGASNSLLYRHLETGREYSFYNRRTLLTGVQLYRCTGSYSRTNKKAKCKKFIHVHNGYFLANPAIGHTCIATKSTIENQIKILAERAAGLSHDILLHHHPETRQEYRFFYNRTLLSGVQYYRCSGNGYGTSFKCTKYIHVENGYFLGNPAVGHTCMAM